MDWKKVRSYVATIGVVLAVFTPAVLYGVSELITRDATQTPCAAIDDSTGECRNLRYHATNTGLDVNVQNSLQTSMTGSATLGDTLWLNSQGLTATVVPFKASGGTISTIDVTNGGTICFLQFFNKLVGAVTLGVTTPDVVFGFSATTSRAVPLPVPLLFSTGISLASTTTATGSTGCNPSNVTIVGQ